MSQIVSNGVRTWFGEMRSHFGEMRSHFGAQAFEVGHTAEESHECSMLNFFSRLTSVADAQAQNQRLLDQSAAASAAHCQPPRTPPRHPGRPKKLLDAHRILAAASQVTHDQAPPPESERASKRAKYTNWFASPLIHDILAAYKMNDRSAKKTVSFLQRTYPRLSTEPEGRFAHLHESTIRSWFDSEGELHEKHRHVLQEQANLHRGPGRTAVLEAHPDIEKEAARILIIMRERGAIVNVLTIRLVFRVLIDPHDDIIRQLKLSNNWCQMWARHHLQWTWRVRTTAASKLPLDWREQGVRMAKRVAFAMQVYKVHPSLVVNMDQTGVNLVPVGTRTYESKGAKEVKVIGAEDKRQITCCVASSLDGDLLPMQLIFQGKTDQCHPPATPASREANVNVTHSKNHWSNQETMQQWVTEVLVAYAERKIASLNLPHDSHIILVLDVWAVHISEEFRFFLRTHHPRIHLVFVPPNCTSQLQVADVILQRSFKHGIRQQFNLWAVNIIQEQIRDGDLNGLMPYLKMSIIKPHILQWCIDSWKKMEAGREFIKMGWHTCCTSMFDVHNVVKRTAVVEEVARGGLDATFVPVRGGAQEELEEDAAPVSEESDGESDDEKDVLDVMKERQYGHRRSTRKRNQPAISGYVLNSSQIALSEDSEA